MEFDVKRRCMTMQLKLWIELNWIGLDWIGLDWIGLDWIGLDWIELNWIVWLLSIVWIVNITNLTLKLPLSLKALSLYSNVQQNNYYSNTCLNGWNTLPLVTCPLSNNQRLYISQGKAAKLITTFVNRTFLLL